MVRTSVEATLNQMLEAEADRLCQAEKYQRSEARKDTRAGFYQRKLHTKAGEVTLNMPKLRQQTFETAIIEGYRRREASVEEALIEMYLAAGIGIGDGAGIGDGDRGRDRGRSQHLNIRIEADIFPFW
jgi:putative transposase